MKIEYPIGGYAPGNYQCRCLNCKEYFQGDKLSVQCEPCAINALNKKVQELSNLIPQLQTPICCEQFKRLICTFEWFGFQNDDDDKLLMPHITVNDVKVRINFCPSCGANVRNIQITKSDYNKYFNNYS